MRTPKRSAKSARQDTNWRNEDVTRNMIQEVAAVMATLIVGMRAPLTEDERKHLLKRLSRVALA